MFDLIVSVCITEDGLVLVGLIFAWVCCLLNGLVAFCYVCLIVFNSVVVLYLYLLV